MSVIQNSTSWYFPSPASMDIVTMMIADLMHSSVFKDTAMERYDARQYGRPPASFDLSALNVTMADIVRVYMTDDHPGQFFLLTDGIVGWMYRNTDGPVRDALLMLSWYLKDQVTKYVPDGKHAIPKEKAVDLTAVSEDFAGESVNFMTNVIRHAAITVPMEARLPMNQCKQTYSELAAISSVDKQLAQDAQLVDESQRALRSVNPSMNLIVPNEGPGSREYAIKRLFQTVQVISMIKSEDNFSTLRAFLSNAQTFAVTARVKGLDNDLRATDLMPLLASVERSVTAHSYTAMNLIARAEGGQLVYAEMLRLVKEWHNLMNNDMNTVFAVFANVFKSIMDEMDSKNLFETEGPFMKQIDDMLTRTEIKSTYLMRRSRLSGR